MMFSHCVRLSFFKIDDVHNGGPSGNKLENSSSVSISWSEISTPPSPPGTVDSSKPIDWIFGATQQPSWQLAELRVGKSGVL